MFYVKVNITYLKVAAQAGQNVTLVDLKPELLEKSQKSIQGNLTRVAKKIYKDDKGKIDNFVKVNLTLIKLLVLYYKYLLFTLSVLLYL